MAQKETKEIGSFVGETARQRFMEALPGRKVLLTLKSHRHSDVREVIDSVGAYPRSYFKLLGIVNPEDCLALFEHQDHFHLWESLAYSKDNEAAEISRAAKASLGEENLLMLSNSLVKLTPEIPSTLYIRNIEALAGIKLISSLSLAQSKGIFVEYGNIARAKTDAFDDKILRFLSDGANVFANVFVDSELTKEDLEASKTVLEELTLFAKKKLVWQTSNDVTNKDNTALVLNIARRKSLREGYDPSIVRRMDDLMAYLGYKYSAKEKDLTYRRN